MKRVYIECSWLYLVRVAVSVAVVRVAVDHFGDGWLAAAVDGRAICDFDLNRRVVDAEVVAQLVVQALQDGLALRERHLDHPYVTDVIASYLKKNPVAASELDRKSVV